MDIDSRDIVARQEIDPPHRHLVIDSDFETVLTELNRHNLIAVDDESFRGLLSVVFSGSFRGTEFLQPADMFPATAEKQEKSIEDYLSPVDSEMSDANEPTQNATEFVFSGYVDSPDLSKETNRDYVSECDACVKKIVTILGE